MRDAMLRVVRIAAQASRDADRLLALSVAEARAHGATWEEIARSMNVSEEAARERYRGRVG